MATSSMFFALLMCLLCFHRSNPFAVGGGTYHRDSTQLHQSSQQQTETTSAKTSRTDADPDVRFMRMALDAAIDQ